MSYFEESIERELLDSIGRMNDQHIPDGSITFSNVRNGISGFNTQVTGTAVPGLGYEGENNFNYNRIDIGKYPNALCSSIPARAAKRVSEVLDLINNSTKLNLRPEDIIDNEIDISGEGGESFVLTCSPKSGRYRGSLGITTTSRTDYRVEGVAYFVEGVKYRITDKKDFDPLPAAVYSTLTINDEVQPLDAAGYFTYKGKSGEQNFVFTSLSIDGFGLAIPIVALNRLKCEAAFLNLANFFTGSRNLKTIGDNVFKGNTCEMALSGFATECVNLVSVGENFFSDNGGISSMTSMFQNCSKLATIGESKPTTVPNNSVGIDNILSGCKALKAVPKGMFQNMQACTSIMRAFIYLGASTPTGCLVAREIFETMVNVTAADEAFNAAKIANWSYIDFTNLVNLETAGSCFSGSNLNNTERASFSNCKKLRFAGAAYRSVSAPVVVAGPIFAKGSSVDAQALFYAVNITSITEDAFPDDCLTGVTGMFQEGTLPEVLPNLFKAQSKLTILNAIFRSTTMTLTAFNDDLFAGCGNVTAMDEVFRYARLRGGTFPAKIFHRMPNVVNMNSAFAGCSGDGVKVVFPKGLFAKQAKVTAMISTFMNAANLEFEGSPFPETKTVTDITRFFNNCNMVTIPEDILEHCDNVTVAVDAFAMSQIQEYPAGMLKPLGKLVNAKGLFSNPIVLRSFAKGFFDPLVSVTNFADGFSGSRWPIELHSGLFDKMVNLESVEGMFRRGVGTIIAPGLFYNNLKLKNAKGVFDASKISGDLTNMFSPKHVENKVDISSIFATTDLSATNFGQAKMNLPITGNVTSAFLAAILDRNIEVTTGFIAMNDIGPNNHLGMTNLRSFLQNCEWLVGSRDAAIQGLWNVQQTSEVPVSVVNESGLNSTGLK